MTNKSSLLASRVETHWGGNGLWLFSVARVKSFAQFVQGQMMQELLQTSAGCLASERRSHLRDWPVCDRILTLGTDTTPICLCVRACVCVWDVCAAYALLCFFSFLLLLANDKLPEDSQHWWVLSFYHWQHGFYRLVLLLLLYICDITYLFVFTPSYIQTSFITQR